MYVAIWHIDIKKILEKLTISKDTQIISKVPDSTSRIGLGNAQRQLWCASHSFRQILIDSPNENKFPVCRNCFSSETVKKFQGPTQRKKIHLFSIKRTFASHDEKKQKNLVKTSEKLRNSGCN